MQEKERVPVDTLGFQERKRQTDTQTCQIACSGRKGLAKAVIIQ